MGKKDDLFEASSLPHSIFAHWVPRGEDDMAIARRLKRWLNFTRDFGWAKGRWIANERTPITAKSYISPRWTVSQLAEFAHKKRMRTETLPRVIMPGAGCLIHGRNVINHRRGFMLQWHANVGSAPCEYPTFEQMLVLGSHRQPHFHNWRRTRALIQGLIDVWEPDWCECHGVWDPYPDLRRYTFRDGVPTVGWILYLKERALKPSDVPSAAKVLPMGKSGSLIVVREKPIDMGKKSDLALADKVRRELKLLRPFVRR